MIEPHNNPTSITTSKNKTLFRSYKLLHKTNPHKLNSLFSLYKIYTKEYKTFITQHWHNFLNNRYHLISTAYDNDYFTNPNSINNLAYFDNILFPEKFKFTHQGSTKHINTSLNASYLQCCLQQVSSTLNGQLSAIANIFSSIIKNSSLDNDILHQLRAINLNKAWLKNSHVYYPEKIVINDFGYETKYKIKHEVLVSQESLFLARKIFKYIIKHRIKFPKTNKPKLVLDNRTCEIQPNKSSKTFDYWLNISTLEKGNKILIPIQSNEQFSQAIGSLGNTVEFNFMLFDYLIKQHKHSSLNNHNKKDYQYIESNKQLDVIFNKKYTIVEQQSILNQQFHNQQQTVILNNSEKTHVVGFDLGLSTLIASSDGNNYGNHWLDKLTRYDGKITGLMKSRQQLGLKVKCKRYDELIRQVRGFIKSEINRILNKYIKENHYILKTIVIEKLYFNNPNLSRKLNRIIKNFGQQLFKDKLKSLGLIYNIEVKEINSAYTSQQCNKCDYVDENNRKQQKLFKCLCCGIKLHADYNASITIVKRFDDDSKLGFAGLLSKRQVLEKLKRLFLRKVETLFLNGQITRRSLLKLLSKNKYFTKDEINFVRTRGVQGVEPAVV